MVEGSIPENIKNILDCSICFEEYSATNYPCTLECGHTICIKCILQLLSTHNILTCPFDKKRIKATILSANLSYFNLLMKVKVFYTGGSFKPILQPKMKFTKPCRNFSRTGGCRYGENCKYLHRAEESDSSDSDDSFVNYRLNNSLDDSEVYAYDYDVYSGESIYSSSEFRDDNYYSDSSDYW